MNDQVLIDKIATNPVLLNAISKMVDRTKALNLVQPDWLNVLKNNDLYKKFENGDIKFSKGRHTKGEVVFVRNIIGMSNCFNIIVAGYWSFGRAEENCLEETPRFKPVTMDCRLCSPLTEIGKIMMESKQQKLHDNCKFFIEQCGPEFCNSCKISEETLMSASKEVARNILPNNWCILKTKIYNGEKVKNIFRRQVEQTLGSSMFSGVLNITISSRYTFGDNSMKIGGICREMLLFKESSLDSTDELDVDFYSFQETEPIPAITLPSDEMVVETIPEDLEPEPKKQKVENCC